MSAALTRRRALTCWYAFPPAPAGPGVRSGCTGLVGSFLGAANWLAVGRPVRAVVVLGWGGCGTTLLTQTLFHHRAPALEPIVTAAVAALVLFVDQVSLQRHYGPLSGGWRTLVLAPLAALFACNMSLGMLANAAGWVPETVPAEVPVVEP